MEVATSDGNGISDISRDSRLHAHTCTYRCSQQLRRAEAVDINDRERELALHDTRSREVRPKLSLNPPKACHIWVADLPYTSSKMLPCNLTKASLHHTGPHLRCSSVTHLCSRRCKDSVLPDYHTMRPRCPARLQRFAEDAALTGTTCTLSSVLQPTFIPSVLHGEQGTENSRVLIPSWTRCLT